MGASRRGERAVGERARWPDAVIVVALVGLTGLGIAAVFGGTIRGWFVEPAAAPPPTATALGSRPPPS